MSNLPKYPLQNVHPKYDCTISQPSTKISEVWLQNQYQQLSLNQPRENRKRFRNGEEMVQDEMDSNDEMLLSDTDMSVSQAQVSVTAHPPKRRLTSVTSVMLPVTALTPTFPGDADWHEHERGTSGNTVGNTEPRTPEGATSNTPVSDMEEQPQQLPLPSPSASPIHSSSSKHDLVDPLESLLMNPPTTQGDLIGLIQSLSSFLTEKNQGHLVFKLLQNLNRATLSSITDIINNNLTRDFLSDLPSEISKKILGYLGHESLYSISLVCSKWYKIINSSNVWIELLQKDHLMDSMEEIESELSNPQQLIAEWADPASSNEINIPQLLYKKRFTIYNRWMDPEYEPRRLSIKVPSQGNNVVTCLQHDDEKIVTGVDDKLINVYNTKTGELLKVLKGHEGGVWALKYTGNTLVSGATDRTVRIWNIKTGKCTHIFKGHTSTVRCLDILHPVKIGVDDAGKDIIFPEEPLLVTGSRDHNLNVWRLPQMPEDEDEDEDIDGGSLSNEDITYDSSDPNNPYLVKVLVGHTQSVRSVSGYGNLIVSGSYDTNVRVWDLLKDGECVQVLDGHADRIYSTVLDYPKKICYSGSMDSTINVWNVETGELLHTLRGHGSLVGLLELSKEYLVSAAADSTLRVWDPNTGENLSKLEGHSAAITCFQHDVLRIVSGSERMLKLWDIRKGKFVKDILADVTGGIWQVRFDFNRCVAAVQRSINDREETFIEILDYSTPLNQIDS